MENQADLPVENVLNLYDDDIETAFSGEVFMTNEEKEMGKSTVKSEIKDAGIEMLKEYMKVVAPDLYPISVEQEFQLAVPTVEVFLQ